MSGVRCAVCGVLRCAVCCTCGDSVLYVCFLLFADTVYRHSVGCVLNWTRNKQTPNRGGQVFNKFGESQGLLSKFFKKAALDPSLNTKPVLGGAALDSVVGGAGAASAGGSIRSNATDAFQAVKRQSSGGAAAGKGSLRGRTSASASSRGRIEIEVEPEGAPRSAKMKMHTSPPT